MPKSERTKAHPLTDRELDVLKLLSKGVPGDEAAKRLGITPNTYRTHVDSIRKVLGVHTALEAVAIGLRKGWIK